MNLRAEILKENSKANSQRISNWVLNDFTRFEQLMQLFLCDEYRVVQRAARIISRIAEQDPQPVLPWLPQLISKANESDSPAAVKRNIMRLMQFIEIPANAEGDAMDLCFKLLMDPKETIAVHCFSMTVLSNFSKSYPEIKPELKMIIEDHLQHQVTPGFLSRARKVLAHLR